MKGKDMDKRLIESLVEMQESMDDFLHPHQPENVIQMYKQIQEVEQAHESNRIIKNLCLRIRVNLALYRDVCLTPSETSMTYRVNIVRDLGEVIEQIEIGNII